MNDLIDFRKEAIIDKKWNFASGTKEVPEGVMITGPNSFIGVHIVDYLQKNTKLPIHLLIRAENESLAIDKMQKSFGKWGLGSFKAEGIQFYCGNVCDENFGLSDDDYRTLTEQTGTVIHLAMNPLYHLPYDFFRQNWIPELEKMIAYCGNHDSPKSLHYTSSFNATFFQNETDFAAVNTNAWQSGYAAFKWVASEAIKNAFSQNLNGCIYDVPLVIGSLEKGLCPDNYSIWHIFNIFLATGCFFPFSFRIIPVNILAESICFNILNGKKEKGIKFSRPVLDEPVTDLLIEKTASEFGLRKSSAEEARNYYPKKLRFDFMIPSSFNELLDMLYRQKAIFPADFDTEKLPSADSLFQVNLSGYLKRNGFAL